MPSVTYDLPAASYPAIQAPTTYLNPELASPETKISSKIVPGETTVGLDKVNRNAGVVDAGQRLGGGGWGIGFGLDITNPSGVNWQVGLGQGDIDGPITIATAATGALGTPNSITYFWLQQGRVVSTKADPDQTPPAAVNSIYLGRVVVVASVVTSIDRGGVLFRRGGVLWRRTADEGMPTDTPPSTIQFMAQTKGGRYWWTGTEYIRVYEAAAMQPETIATGESLIIPSGYQAQWFNYLQVDGYMQVDGHSKVEDF